jgi:SAM-dependent methyltransferase
MDSALQQLRETLRQTGLKGTLLRALAYVADYWWDLKYHTDTFTWVAVERLGIDAQTQDHAYRYQPSQAIPLRQLLRALAIPPGKVLVDFGCGKGKVLLLAAEFGFAEVRGIEVSPLLCDIARHNCATYREKTNTPTQFVIVQADARQYPWTDDEEVFFFFNPFDAVFLEHVIGCIRASLQRRKRKIWILYGHPLHRATVEEALPASARREEFRFWGQDFMVFVVEPGPALQSPSGPATA